LGEDHLERFLRECHRKFWQTKEDNYHISPSVFDPKKVAATFRATDNIVFLQHLWLDFENGNLRPHQVPDLFPHLRMVVTNSFHHTANKPRFRVVIPTTQTMTPDAYSIIYEGIAYKLEDAGYKTDRDKKSKARKEGKPKSGLDWSKAAPTSLFYLPCQAENPSHSFFEVYSDAPRAALDPTTWIENSGHLIKAEEERPTPREEGQLNQVAVDAAVAEWRGSTAYPGEGGYRFFMLGVQLRSAGMDHHDIKATLDVEAAYGRSPKERKAQIRSIMNTLRGGR